MGSEVQSVIFIVPGVLLSLVGLVNGRETLRPALSSLLVAACADKVTSLLTTDVKKSNLIDRLIDPVSDRVIETKQRDVRLKTDNQYKCMIG